MGTTITQATEADIPDLVEIWKDYMDYHRDIDSFYTVEERGPASFGAYLAELMGQENVLIVKAENGDECAGFAIAKIESRPPVYEEKMFGHITDMAVRPTHRRHGAGERMLERLFDWFRQRNISRVQLNVVPDNSVGFSFWRKMGFETFLLAMYKEI